MPAEDLRKLIYAGKLVGYEGDEIQFLEEDGPSSWSKVLLSFFESFSKAIRNCLVFISRLSQFVRNLFVLPPRAKFGKPIRPDSSWVDFSPSAGFLPRNRTNGKFDAETRSVAAFADVITEETGLIVTTA